MRTRVLVLVAMGATFAACSLTTNLDGLSGGDVPDASPGAAEAGSDGPLAEGGADSSTAGDAADGGLVDPCVGAVLCDRFERAAPDGVWGSVYTDHGGVAAIDGTTSTSSSRSLVLHVPGTGDPHAQLGSIGYPNVAHARVAFSMKCGVANRQISLMRIQLTVDPRGAVFDIFMMPSGIVAAENVFGMPTAGFAESTISDGFVPDTWQRWSLELDATGTTALGIVTLDGIERVRKPLKNAFERGVLTVLAGVFYAPDGPAQDIHYDDVSITILP